MTTTQPADKKHSPRILVFSTEKISDPGIDLAGLLKMHYPPQVYTIILPCSSAVKPRWVIRALKKGLDGVFVAADGTDCPCRSDCTELTARIIREAQETMKREGFNPARLKMAAICSVCAESFANHMRTFAQQLVDMTDTASEPEVQP